MFRHGTKKSRQDRPSQYLRRFRREGRKTETMNLIRSLSKSATSTAAQGEVSDGIWTTGIIGPSSPEELDALRAIYKEKERELEALELGMVLDPTEDTSSERNRLKLELQDLDRKLGSPNAAERFIEQMDTLMAQPDDVLADAMRSFYNDLRTAVKSQSSWKVQDHPYLRALKRRVGSAREIIDSARELNKKTY